MVARVLNIRNLTSTPVAVKRVERYDGLGKRRRNGFQTAARNLTRVLTNVTRTDEPIAALNGDDEPFLEVEVDVRVEPFCTVQTDIPSFINSYKERMRLVIETEGEKHQIQIPVPAEESATMTALTDKPRFQFTGIYVTAEAHLAIFSSANLNSWMRELRDDALLSALSIPGTHNSPTCYVAAPSVRCQAVSPREQLENGVRFFDIRLHPRCANDPTNDALLLVHSVFPISFKGNKYFTDLMQDVHDFLDSNPSETIILSLKREGPGKHTDEQLSRVLHDHYAKPASTKRHRWFTEPKVPTLGEVRGKIVLLRRFAIDDTLRHEHDGRGWGIDATGWDDNTPHSICPSGHICIQDYYGVMVTKNIAKKIQYVREQIARASRIRYPFGIVETTTTTTTETRSREYPLFINFLSASNFWKLGTWPERIAAKLNPATVDYLCRIHGARNEEEREAEAEGDWSTGILVTDWVGLDGDWDLVRAIVGMNARLMMRQTDG